MNLDSQKAPEPEPINQGRRSLLKAIVAGGFAAAVSGMKIPSANADTPNGTEKGREGSFIPDNEYPPHIDPAEVKKLIDAGFVRGTKKSVYKDVVLRVTETYIVLQLEKNPIMESIVIPAEDVRKIQTGIHLAPLNHDDEESISFTVEYNTGYSIVYSIVKKSGQITKVDLSPEKHLRDHENKPSPPNMPDIPSRPQRPYKKEIDA